ncbi:hypothetical protein [Bacillus sp. T33-2]|uniref:hypothetical protein n=1 Tax=Bacillus sp. T33-2 TaxID=2054168 RepID=UPI000C769CC4|nr:hypothetical protein [Bacillus sp. T33-2]PLR99605.1 hypothetical protein CVD19_00650 [Bacillus sp. T33-2]
MSAELNAVRSCEDCGFFKEYINRRKMEELQTDNVIWFWHCENQNTPSEIKNLNFATQCQYYDDESWMK